MKDFEYYLRIANRDILMTRNQNELRDYVASLLYEYDELQQENQQLKIQYEKLEEKYIHNVPCCNENDCDLYREHKKLENNWNELKKWLEENWKETQDIWYVKIINKMQELEGKSE